MKQLIFSENGFKKLYFKKYGLRILPVSVTYISKTAFGTHTYIDLLKLIDKSYGSATLGLQTPKPLNFWMRFGGFGSSSNPGNGWSGEPDIPT